VSSCPVNAAAGATLTTVTGAPGSGFVDGVGLNARIDVPLAVVYVPRLGGLLMADTNNDVLRLLYTSNNSVVTASRQLNTCTHDVPHDTSPCLRLVRVVYNHPTFPYRQCCKQCFQCFVHRACCSSAALSQRCFVDALCTRTAHLHVHRGSSAATYV
jgi:hypothetical protein